MKCTCPRQEELKTVHSYSAGENGSTSEMVCPCGKKFVFVKLLFAEVQEHGQGAYAVAQRIKRGQIKIGPPNSGVA